MAKTEYESEYYPTGGIQAKITADGHVCLQPTSPTIYRNIQTTLRDSNIPFSTFPLSENRTLKVVIKGIPTDISEEEIKSELEARGFEVKTLKTIKRFGASTRPLSIYLVIITKNPTSFEIYDITNLFNYSVTVESFKKTGPS